MLNDSPSIAGVVEITITPTGANLTTSYVAGTKTIRYDGFSGQAPSDSGGIDHEYITKSLKCRNDSLSHTHRQGNIIAQRNERERRLH